MRQEQFLRAMFALIFMAFALGAVPVYGGTTGIISGIVTDSETGEALAGVNVILEGTNMTTVTDTNGYYVITNVSPGSHRVVGSLVGYSDVLVRQVSVLMDVTSTASFAMTPAVAEEEEITVIESRPMVRHDVIPTMYVVDREQEKMVRSQPGSIYQTPGLVITQPGVVADADGYPHIRGGRVNQVGYMLDGIPITEPLTNAFGTNIVTVGLDKMEMFTGGYRPEYGNAISGVFNQITKTGKTSPGATLEMLGGSMGYKGVHPEIGGSASNGFDYYVGAYLWNSEFKRSSVDEANSSDVIGKFNYALNDRNNITMLIASGSATYEFPSLHTQTYGTTGFQPTGTVKDHVKQSHMLTALTFSHQMSPSSFVTLRPYQFKNTYCMDALSDEIGYWWESGSTVTGLQLDYTNQVSKNHLVKLGAIRLDGDNHYWANVPAWSEWGMGDYEYTANTDSLQTGLYVQDQMRIGDRWGAEAGLRYDRMKYDKKVNPDSSESQLSPRVGLSYVLDPQTNVRMSYGKMIQFVHTQAVERDYVDPESLWNELYYGIGTGDLRPERCTQYDLGVEHQMNDNVAVQVTPFYRKYADLLQTKLLDPENPDWSPLVYDNLGEASAKGVELLLKLRPTNGWSGWLAYTYSKARAQTSYAGDIVVPGVTQFVDWDQRHTVALVTTYAKDKWNYTLFGQYGSGLPYNLDGEPINSRRNSSNTVFSLNISREITGGWLPQGQMNLSIANLFNTGKALDRGPDGEPIATVAPRFVSLSFLRRF